MSAVDFWAALDEDLNDLAKQLRPIKAYVGNENSAGRVTLRFPGQDQPTQQRYPRLDGPRFDPGTPVYVLRRGDRHLVLGKISDGSWTGGGGGGLNIKGVLLSPIDLPPTGDPGDAWLIDGDLWLWVDPGWVNAGPFVGPEGPEGPQGPRGEKGETGERGPEGPRGLQGERGEKGEKGDQGEPGEKGEKGDKGDKGDQGEQGIQGIQGPDGPRGDQGDIGPEGPEGPQGPRGEKGETGDTGAKGDPGTGLNLLGSLDDPGDLPAVGDEGDAYLIAGDVWMWLSGSWQNVGRIQGPEGPQGPPGADGANGEPGPPGDNGQDGAKGDPGDPGPAGADGAQGPPGEAATVTVGNTTTGAAGTPASVTQRGTAQARIFDFTIPQGAKGDKGDKGDPGQDGAQGPPGPVGSFHAIFPLNKQIRPDQGNYNCRSGPGTSFPAVTQAAPNTQVHDTGIRHAADGYTWAYMWLSRYGWVWTIQDAFG